jgi:secreted PhoX family phosphatase
VKRRMLTAAVVVGLIAAVVGVAVAATGDFGVDRDRDLRKRAGQLFGLTKPLTASSTSTAPLADANTDASKLATFAKGLQVRVITQGTAGQNIDQMGLWPDDLHPSHLIACTEEGTTEPGLQSIDVETGEVVTLVTGLTACDPVRVTPWGTILFGEENGSGPTGGRMYELIDPLSVHDVVLDRTTGIFSGGVGADHLVARPALGRLSFEGLAIMPNGVTYYGDENRPSTGTPGGAYFKFIPASLRDPSAGPITSLGDSPYANAGTIYGLRLGKRSGNTDYGQGTQYGLGTWILVADATMVDPDLRPLAATNDLTGYYRPEDLEIDRAALAAGNVRACGADTGNESNDRLWGEVICLTDGSIADAGTNSASPEVQLVVVGGPELAMPDNVAYQPGRGNWVIHEDGDGPIATIPHNNDLWDCLPDGADEDTLSDGCVRIASINDLVGSEGAAEWTGGIFDRLGTRFYVSVQHNETGFGVVYEVTGWR